jgi:ATP-dependent Clp protease ATP-binding subunit ClpB
MGHRPEDGMRLNKRLDPSLAGHQAETLHNDLLDRVVGQEQAVDHIVNVYQTHLAGMSSPGRPIGNFLFLGPTGTGKTRLVEATAESLVGDMRAVVRIDCAEFQHGHEIAKLIGSPPGYLGHSETHPMLSQEVLNQHHTDKVKIGFVLFDEIEKANAALWNLLLGILDKATLTLGDNRRVDFSRTMIFMTSNLGAAEMGSMMRPGMGFATSRVERARSEGQVDDQLRGEISRVGVEAARRRFTPEFMNRIDKVVVFQPLGTEQLLRILALELTALQNRIVNAAGATPFVINVTSGARDFLLREGTDIKYGARHLKRAVERSLLLPISNLIASDQIHGGDLIRVDYDDEIGCLAFTKDAEEIPPSAMAEMIDSDGVSVPATVSVSAAPGYTRPATAKRQRTR